jgi:hypothetical protein
MCNGNARNLSFEFSSWPDRITRCWAQVSDVGAAVDELFRPAGVCCSAPIRSTWYSGHTEGSE